MRRQIRQSNQPLRHQRAVKAGHVGHKRGIGNRWQPVYSRHNGRTIRQLRHPFRADKTGRFDIGKTAFRQKIDQGNFGCGGNGNRFILQPVTRTHLKNTNAVLGHFDFPFGYGMRLRLTWQSNNQRPIGAAIFGARFKPPSCLTHHRSIIP